MTSPSNYSSPPVSEFLLICFPNHQSWQHWLSLPLSLLFLLAMGTNTTLLITIRLEASLHEPMYYLLSLLSLLDVALCLTIIPKVLAIFWFDLSTILLVVVLTNVARKMVPMDILILLNVFHHLIPSALNPVVYGVQTKEIKQGIQKLLQRGM
ncbi:hypothetical protein CapIbe_012977 [Capra ibex]